MDGCLITEALVQRCSKVVHKNFTKFLGKHGFFEKQCRSCDCMNSVQNFG